MTRIIRPATPGDAECLAALAIQVWLHTYARDGIRSAIARYVLSEFTAERFTRILADPAARLLVAEVDRHIVGYVLVVFDATCPTNPQCDVELATLYVQEPFVRKGLGSALLARARELVRERTDGARLWLAVNARNARAIAFYRKHRFREAGTTQFEFGGEKHENLVFAAGDAGA